MDFRVPRIGHPLGMSAPPVAALPPSRNPTGPYRICLVCLGNICRSPMAEVVLRSALADAGLSGEAAVDSAGTGDWHVGHQMEAHARGELSRRGYDGSAHRARQIERSWLTDRDLILAMDQHNLADLRRMAALAGVDSDRIRLFGEVGGLEPGVSGHLDVPDPYGGDSAEFAAVLDLVETAARRIAARVTELLAGRAPA